MKTAAREDPAKADEDKARIPDGSQHETGFDERQKDAGFSFREALTDVEDEDFEEDLHEPCLRFQK